MYADYLSQARNAISLSEFRQIHKKAQNAVDELKSKEAEVIRALQKVDQYKVYRYLGLNSLFQYGLSLGLSESQCYAYITVARKSIECPKLQEAIESKEITVSKAKTITSVIETKNQVEWLNLAKTLPRRELEKKVAEVNPKTIKKESSRYLTDHVLELNLSVEEDTYKLLQRAKELLAQKYKRPVTLDEALRVIAGGFVSKEDPVERAKRATGKKQSKRKRPKQTKTTGVSSPVKLQSKPDPQFPPSPSPGRVAKKATEKATEKADEKTTEKLNAKTQKSNKNRKALPRKILHQVHLRDQGACQHKDNSHKLCGQRQWVEIHHIKPVSQGGGDSLENLITLCSTHHKIVHGRT